MEIVTQAICTIVIFICIASAKSISIPTYCLPTDQLPSERLYHYQEEIDTFSSEIAQTYPTKAHLYSIGWTTLRHPMNVLAIALSQPYGSVYPRAEVKLVGSIHGDEPLSTEVLMCLALFLVNPPQESRREVEHILYHHRIHILFRMNIDPFDNDFVDHIANQTVSYGCYDGDNRFRINRNKIDLNRNFPNPYQNRSQPIQMETQAIVSWTHGYPFIASVAYHMGAELVNIPLDSKPGSMQDYNYHYHGILAFTIELDCCKVPLFLNATREAWKYEQYAILDFFRALLIRVEGVIVDAEGRGIRDVPMKIKGINSTFNSTVYGEFWRMVVPGDHELQYRVPKSGEGSVRFRVEQPPHRDAQQLISPTRIRIVVTDHVTSLSSTTSTATPLT